MKNLASGMVVLLLLGCSAPESGRVDIPPKYQSNETTVEETPKPAKVDPFMDKLGRFEAAYAELVCKANPDVDPTTAVATVRCPYERLEQLAGEKSFTLDVYLAVLAKHGFPSADEYFKAKEYIHKARPGWFDSLKNRLLDYLEKCKRQ